jgi:hypothetical protein
MGGLVKKQIIDKRGRRTSVWVNPTIDKKNLTPEGVIAPIADEVVKITGQKWVMDRVVDMLRNASITHGHPNRDNKKAVLTLKHVDKDFPLKGSVKLDRADGAKVTLSLKDKKWDIDVKKPKSSSKDEKAALLKEVGKTPPQLGVSVANGVVNVSTNANSGDGIRTLSGLSDASKKWLSRFQSKMEGKKNVYIDGAPLSRFMKPKSSSKSDEAKSNKPSKHAQELSEELGGKDRKKIAGNTYAIKDGGDIHVKLYDTNVVTHKSDGSIKLDSGGFMTKTTKSRINDFSDAQVYQKKGDWFVDYKGKTHDFKDGMTLK